MARLTVDTSEAKAFEPVEPGPYPMTVDFISEVKKGKDKGTKYVDWEYKFDDPELDRKSGKVIRGTPVEGKGAGFFREAWKAATGEDLPLDAEIDVDTDDAIGRHVIVSVVNEEYEGRLQNKASKVVAAS